MLKETPSGGGYTQTTIGSGLSFPNGVAVDGSGNVYIADTNNNQVLKETLSGGNYTQSTVANQSNNGLQLPVAWRWMAAGTSISPIPSTAGC